MRVIITDWDTSIEKKFVQKWKLGKRVCSQSITVDGTLIWEDSFDTQGTVFDTESDEQSEKFDQQFERQLMNQIAAITDDDVVARDTHENIYIGE